MNKEQAIKRIEAIEAEAKELRAIIDAPERKPWQKWKPAYSELYYYISNYGVVYRDYNNADNHHQYRSYTGNTYHTKEEAERALEILTRASELIGDWQPDWDDDDQYKYQLSYNHSLKEWYTRGLSWCQSQGLWFPTHESAQTMIYEFGDDLFLIMNRV